MKISIPVLFTELNIKMKRNKNKGLTKSIDEEFNDMLKLNEKRRSALKKMTENISEVRYLHKKKNKKTKLI